MDRGDEAQRDRPGDISQDRCDAEYGEHRLPRVFHQSENERRNLHLRKEAADHYRVSNWKDRRDARKQGCSHEKPDGDDPSADQDRQGSHGIGRACDEDMQEVGFVELLPPCSGLRPHLLAFGFPQQPVRKDQRHDDHGAQVFPHFDGDDHRGRDSWMGPQTACRALGRKATGGGIRPLPGAVYGAVLQGAA